MITEWAVRHRSTLVVTPRADRLDAENSVRLNTRLEVVSREVEAWHKPSSVEGPDE